MSADVAELEDNVHAYQQKGERYGLAGVSAAGGSAATALARESPQVQQYLAEYSPAIADYAAQTPEAVPLGLAAVSAAAIGNALRYAAKEHTARTDLYDALDNRGELSEHMKDAGIGERVDKWVTDTIEKLGNS